MATKTDDATKTTVLSKFLTQYELPDGAKLIVRKPDNKVRRLLVDNPDQQVRYLLDTIAAVSLTELSFPDEYSPKVLEAKKLSFNPDDEKLNATAYNRFDELSLLDMEAFSAAYKAENMPTAVMVEGMLEKIKAAREAAKPAGKA